MLTRIIALITFLAPACIFSQSLDEDCLKRMHTGVFTYTAAEQEVEVIRTQRIQVEVMDGGHSKLYLNVVWENDSTMVLTMDRGVNAIGCLDHGDIIRTEIVACYHDRYDCVSQSKTCGDSRATLYLSHP